MRFMGFMRKYEKVWEGMGELGNCAVRCLLWAWLVVLDRALSYTLY